MHWRALVEEVGALATVGLRDALAHSVLCQDARSAIATLDSALNKGLISAADLLDVRAMLPTKFAPIFALVDGRAQSGTESLVRLMARGLGCSIELQREFAGVGYVDLVLDGWLVVECDSKAFHAGWEKQKEDRHRDAVLAASGFTTLRLTAEMILYRPDEALAAVRGLVATRRPL